MKDWVYKFIMPYVVKLILENATEEKIKEFLNNLKSKYIPRIRVEKDKYIAELRAKAKATPGKLDDAGVTLLDNILEAFLPDNTRTL